MLGVTEYVFLIATILNAAYGQQGSFYILGLQSGKCVSVNGGSTANGPAIVIYDCIVGAKNQFWTIQDGGQGGNPAITNGFTLVADNSGKCISVLGGRIDNGAPLVQWECIPGGINNQLWEMIPSDQAGYYQFRNPVSQRCASVLGPPNNSASLVLWDCIDAVNQKFTQKASVTWD